MISLDISILYQVLIYLFLFWVLNKILFQPYLSVLEERERRTSGAQHDSADLEYEGARLRAQYEERIHQARSAAAAERENILQIGRGEREKILRQGREEAERHLAAVRQEIAAALVVERRLAAAEASAIAAEIASKALGRKVA